MPFDARTGACHANLPQLLDFRVRGWESNVENVGLLVLGHRVRPGIDERLNQHLAAEVGMGSHTQEVSVLRIDSRKQQRPRAGHEPVSFQHSAEVEVEDSPIVQKFIFEIYFRQLPAQVGPNIGPVLQLLGDQVVTRLQRWGTTIPAAVCNVLGVAETIRFFRLNRRRNSSRHGVPFAGG